MSERKPSYLDRSYQLWRRVARADARDVHFDIGLRAFEERDRVHLARQVAAMAMLPDAGPDSADYFALCWRLAWLEERFDDALAAARAGHEAAADDLDAHLELAQVLSDLERFAESRDVLTRAIERFPGEADLWFELGVVAERMEAEEAAWRAYHEVWRLEQGGDDRPRWLDEAFAHEVVNEVLASLPETIRDALGNIAIFLEEYPEEWVVSEHVADPRILGLMDGPIQGAEGQTEVVTEGPARIYLFRRNIERVCRDADEARDEVAVTLLHEIGHYLGLDEDALSFMGLG